MRTLLDSLQGAIKQSPPLSQGENRQSPPPSRILRTSTVYSALPKEKEKEKEEGTSVPTTQKKGVMKQLHKVYGSKLLLPHLKNESLSPRNLPPVPAPALPALQIDRCDSEGSNRRDNFDDSISKLDPCVRDFLNKTESLLLDVRKIKKKIKRKKQSSQLGDTDDFVKEDISRHPEHNLNLNLSDSPSAVGVGTSLPAIDERRKRDKITSKNISSTLDLRATTPHSSDSRGKMRDALSSSHSSRSIGKHEKRSQSPPYSDSDQECWTVLDDEKDSRQRNLIEMGWTKQQVNEGAVEHHTGEMSADYSRERTVEKNNSSHTTTEWQNELARHILSMYATTTANTNMAGSKAILEFVDTKGEVSFESVSQDLFSSEKSGDRMSNSSTGNRDGDDDSSTRSMKSDLSSIKGDQKTSIEGAISGRDKRRSRDSVTTIRDFSVPAALPRSQAHSDAEKHTQFIQKKKETVALSSSSASNSNSNSNGNGNGPSSSSGGRAVEGEAYLRLKGPPLCFPVWFVGEYSATSSRLHPN